MNHNLLIVDDEYEIREGSAEYLRGVFSNAFIDTAKSGEEACRKLKESSFDAMLLDIRMRGMDGLELLERLKEQESMPLTVLISGYQEFDYARRAIELNVVKYLVKPFSPQELSDTVSMLFLLSEEQNESSGQKEPLEMADPSVTAEAIKRYLDEHYRKKISLKTLSGEFGLNQDYLGKIFKRSTGTSVNSYLSKRRVEEACSLMINTRLNISEIADVCGFSDQTYFSTIFRKITGVAPTDYRNQRQ